MRNADNGCQVKHGPESSLAAVLDQFLDVKWFPATGFGPNRADAPDQNLIGGTATTTNRRLDIIVQMLLILRVLSPLPHYPDAAVAWDVDGDECGVPDAIRHVFSKDMHMQLFSGMQVLSGGLAGKGWADHDARLYTVVTEELMGVSHTIHE